MLPDDTKLERRLIAHIGDSVEVARRGDALAVLTPCDYPDGDGVVVHVVPTSGGYSVSDSGAADAQLIGSGPGTRAIRPVAVEICRRHGARFDGGRVISEATDLDDLAEACWQVAVASVAIAEAATHHRRQVSREDEIADLVESSVRARNLSVERQRELEGASGHRHKASLYVPEREAVLEPVGGEKPWNVAAAVYVEFGDLGGANGYRLIAVLDDRELAPGEDVERLLRQVGTVAYWSRADEWLEALARESLL